MGCLSAPPNPVEGSKGGANVRPKVIIARARARAKSKHFENALNGTRLFA